jgi:hypothetical protein
VASPAAVVSAVPEQSHGGDSVAARAPRSAPARQRSVCPDHSGRGVGHRDELGLRARLGVDALPELEAYTGPRPRR